MEINYHLPSFTDHYSLNLLMFDYMKEHPEYFRDGIRIASAFGCFDGSIWNGGRNVRGKYDPVINKKILKEFNDRGIPLRFTFTNPEIEEKHLGDKYCNEIMELANNGLNEVIVFSPILEEYIRENYPKYKITSSTCKQIRNMADLNAELDKNYNLVVIDYNWNNKFDELALIKDKGRCEILVNACCQPQCPRRGDHYSTIGKYQIEICTMAQTLGMNAGNIVKEPFECKYMGYDIYEINKFITHISPDDIATKYVPLGFKQFKLEGRTIGDIDMLEMYVYYFAKPEFERRVRLDMLKRLTGRVKYFNIIK